MKSERDVKRKLVAAITAAGGWYCMPHGAGYGRAGIPDVIASLSGGQFVAFECKFGGNKLSAHQQRELEAIRATGGVAEQVDETNIDQIIARIQKTARTVL